MVKKKIFKTSLILMLLFVLAMPFTMVGCKKNKGEGGEIYTRYIECVGILKTAINNITNNTNDTLNGFGIYVDVSGELYEDLDGFNEIYFESTKGENHDINNYYASYYLRTEQGDWYKHYTLYSSDNNYLGTNTYAMLTDYEECNSAYHADSIEESLTEMASIYLNFGISAFSEDAIVGWYENFEDSDNFFINCKYSRNGFSTLVKYTIEGNKLVLINAEIFSASRLVGAVTTEIKYDIEVDAYDKYDYAYEHLNGWS